MFLQHLTSTFAAAMKQQVNIAILASGKGSNANRICSFFKNHPKVRVKLIISNKPDAGVLSVADEHAVKKMVITNDRLTSDLLLALRAESVDFVVLAGFLRVVPEEVVQAFRGKMVNIHPALLPAYGGKGMYGNRVHQAVLSAGEKESGITIHQVTEQYDEGDIIFQKACKVNPGDTPDTLAEKIHQLEHRHYPEVIENLILNTFF